MGARYAPAERDFGWDAWIGGGVGLVRVADVTLFGNADVETIIGSERRGFDANQANYHLELGLTRRLGALEAALFFEHVSRHSQDRSKPQAVDWNTLGFRLSGPLAQARPLPTRFLVSVGHTTLASLIGYRFEAIAGLEADIVNQPWGGLYVAAKLRGVTTESSAAFPRDGFLDANFEGGVRIRRGARSFQFFAAYEHRNDVYLVVPGFRDRALIGIRLGIADQARP